MQNRLTVWAFVLILLAIPVLGYVQWRWIERVTDAELESETKRLQTALERVASEFNAETTRAHIFFAPEPGEPEEEALARQLKEWNARAPHPAVVRALYIAYPDDGTALRIGRDGIVQTQPPVLTFAGRRPFGLLGGDPAVFMPMGGRGPRLLFGRPPGPRSQSPEFGPGPARDGLRIVVFDSDALTGTLLPRVLERHVDTRSYKVAVSGPKGLVHGSELTAPDASAPLVAVRPECLLPVTSGGPGRRGPGPAWQYPDRDLLTMPARPCSIPLEDGLWRIDVQHSAGSLAHAVRRVRTQNLTLSFGVLALLTGAVIALWLSIYRARMLAQRQVEFAMSVSHELRTPLTVMRLAGDNLASGMSVSPEQMKRYGETIRTQAERLGSMVEQVLTFARSERPDWHVRTTAVRPEAILQAAIASSETVLRESGCTLESEAEPNLPDIEADANLMTSALSNLLVNAARYGASGKWVRARAFLDEGQVVFEVADRGPGFPSRDVRRVFEPFYRGRNSGGSRGAGLGLHLVRRIATAHGGTVGIESSQGAGATVRIQLPAAERKEETAGEEASADRRG